MGPRNWSLVGNKKWLLLGGSKCTIFVVVAVGEEEGAHDLVTPERSLLGEVINRSSTVFY